MHVPNSLFSLVGRSPMASKSGCSHRFSSSGREFNNAAMMASQDILKFEPSQDIIFDSTTPTTPLCFPLSFVERKLKDGPLTCTLKLTNSSGALDCLFRIQTTSPSTYRVRPSHGRIAAGATQDVQIVMVTDPVKSDKFLIKYVTVSRSLPVSDFSKQFSEAEATTKEHRLRVTVLTDGMATPPPASSTPDAQANSDHLHAGAGMALERSNSMSPTFVDTMPRSSSLASQAPILESKFENQDALLQEIHDAKLKIVDLQRALDEKNSQLVRMRKNSTGAASNEVDRNPIRNGLGPGITEEELKNMLAAQAGFPPVLVLLIALFAFLVGLLF